jgi:hypothetical protein
MQVQVRLSNLYLHQVRSFQNISCCEPRSTVHPTEFGRDFLKVKYITFCQLPIRGPADAGKYEKPLLFLSNPARLPCPRR